MEVETPASQKVVDAIQDMFRFFSEQSMVTYALIVFMAILVVCTLLYVSKMIRLMKQCYQEIDNKGLHKINFLNLISVVCVSLINPKLSIVLNVYFGIFIVPLVAYFIFMFSVLLLNIKRYRNRKNFVRNKQKIAQNEKNLGVRHRISRNDLNGVYQSASEMYRDCQPEEAISVSRDVNRKRLSKDVLQEGNDMF